MNYHKLSGLNNQKVLCQFWGPEVHTPGVSRVTPPSFLVVVVVVVVQSLSCVRLFATPRTAARQASLSITSSQSLLKLMSIESVMPSNHLILWRPLLLPPSIFPSIRVCSKESVFHIQVAKALEFQLSVLLSNLAQVFELINARTEVKTELGSS